MRRCRDARSGRLLLAAVLASGCANELPIATEAVDGGDEVQVTLLGDGFVKVAERRIPFERFLVELRQRARAMTQSQRDRFTVQVRFGAGCDSEERAAVVRASNERLMMEADILEIGRVAFE